ncbi:unnamed protein product [Amoebophrya sp. A25]|nr:unnamed protein product [Amoebophrya sp. A25]|eukprot:GSA25T00010884001.1
MQPGTAEFESFIQSRSYIEDGWDFTAADVAALSKLGGGLPDMEKFPATFRWAMHISALQKTRPLSSAVLGTSSSSSTSTGSTGSTAASKGNGKGNKGGAGAQQGGNNNKGGQQGGNNKGKDEANIENKLPNAVMGKVCTRFPPEPSGYMHIGHAKAALLNHAYARMYNGKMIIRFDDTNPSKEKQEFEDTILEDSKALGIVPDKVTHTSDYFDQLQALMEQFIREGHAYVDDLPAAQMKLDRDAGKESEARLKNDVDANIALWKEMLGGTPRGIECCVRAKMDMKNVVKCLRDPVLYRCKVDVPHHRHGTKFKAYPTYDFACPIVDALEGVSHSLRTIEYKDRDALYEWVQERAKKGKSILYEFSKTQFTHTVLSKRKLTWFVDNGHVESWADPRFPTVKGVLRRGMTVEALQDFMKTQGASKRTVLMEWDKIWVLNRQIIDPKADRYAAISVDDKVTVEIKGLLEKTFAGLVDKHPKLPENGQKVLWYGSTVYLEQADAGDIAEGEEITLLHWGNVICKKLHKANGKLQKIEAELHLAGSVKDTKKKLQWVAETGAETRLTLREYDHLITKQKVEEEDQIEDLITPQSVFDTAAIGEAGLKNLCKGQVVQLERVGFFICDKPAFPEGTPAVLIKIPDGKSKAMSNITGKVDASKLQGGKKPAPAAAPAAAPPAAPAADGAVQASPENLAALAAAKEKVAKLKADGAAAAEVDAAVAEMKRLKEVCGEKELSKAERKKLEKEKKAAANAK